MCDQQRHRSACAYTQIDQRLCKSLECSMTGKLLIEHYLEFLSLKGGCTGSSESTLVKMPHCGNSHAATQILFFSFGSQIRFTTLDKMETAHSLSYMYVIFSIICRSIVCVYFFLFQMRMKDWSVHESKFKSHKRRIGRQFF